MSEQQTLKPPSTEQFSGGIPRPDYKPVRQELTKIIGRENLIELSKGNIWKDIWWGFWPPAAVIVTAVAIGLIDNWWIRVPLIAFNGFNITNCAVVGHSMCSHRRPFGRRPSQVLGTVLHTTSLLSFSVYTASHTHHHNTVNTPADQDFEQSDLDKRWKRLLYATFPGYVIASSRLLAPKSSRHMVWNARSFFRKQLMADPKRKWDVIFEAAYTTTFWTVIAAGCFWKPQFFLLGYVVPLLATSSLANGLREAAEHQGVDISNPWHVATTTRPGWIRRTWLHQTGTTHWVHHMWPNIPHYNCTKVWDTLYPSLTDKGVVENRSFVSDMRSYYIEGRPRATWTDASGVTHAIETFTKYGDPEYVEAHRSPVMKRGE